MKNVETAVEMPIYVGKNMRYAHFAEYAAIAYSHKTDMPKYHVEVSCQWLSQRVCVWCLQCFDAVGWAAGRASGL